MKPPMNPLNCRAEKAREQKMNKTLLGKGILMISLYD